MMKPESTPTTGSRLESIERMLVIVVIACIAVGVAVLVVLLIAAGLHASVWGWVTFMPMICFPLGLLNIIALMIVGIIRRRREGPAQH